MLYACYFLHLQADGAIGVNRCVVRAIYSYESSSIGNKAQVVCKCSDTPAPISTHGTYASIAIIVHHPEIVTCCIFQQHEPVGTNTIMAVTQQCYLFFIKCYRIITVVDQDEIIACTVVFVKM